MTEVESRLDFLQRRVQSIIDECNDHLGGAEIDVVWGSVDGRVEQVARQEGRREAFVFYQGRDYELKLQTGCTELCTLSVQFSASSNEPLSNVKKPYKVMETRLPIEALTPTSFLNALRNVVTAVDVARRHFKRDWGDGLANG